MASDFLVRLGTRGLTKYGGRISEEWLRRLDGTSGARVYREMSDNDETIGAIFFAIEMLIRNVEWRVEPYSADPKHEDEAEFIRTLMEDMEITWDDFISEAISCLSFGFAPFEIVYKRRDGPLQKDPNKKSNYDDGKIGWLELSIRAQDTIDRWQFDDENDRVIGLWQSDPYSPGSEVFIPIEKLILLKTTSRKGNPQGRSVLRNAFLPWYRKKRIAESEAIGVERDLAGMPIFYVPPSLFSENATDHEKAQLVNFTNVVKSIKNDEQAGLVLPASYDENNNQLVKFELAGTGARRLIDTTKIIDRYDRSIARLVLADFLFLGQTAVGSFALSSDKTELFSAAVGAWLKSFAASINRQALPRLYELNGWNPGETATIVAGDLEKEDVDKFTNALVALAGAGWLTPGTEEDENHLRNKMDMPEIDRDLLEAEGRLPGNTPEEDDSMNPQEKKPNKKPNEKPTEESEDE